MKQRYRGSTMITALLFFYLFGVLFLIVAEDYQLTVQYSKKTQAFYTAKVICSMFLSEFRQYQNEDNQGTKTYSKGVLNYKLENQKMTMIVQTSGATYTFYEAVKKTEKDKE
ncbi:competence type IV pilus minor pilin ComGG [Enterococcus sp. LJL128]|uniref:competence type IV pilus minor pilin ComGG n=1 Tax=Enterococcus sp. LJL51 TaxID=3416656 RepID=UPI003CE75A22